MIFIDTAPFIYLIENHPKYYSTIRDYLSQVKLEESSSLLTSTVSIAEFCVIPFRLNRKDIVDKFYSFLNNAPIEVAEITQTVAELSASLRGKYPSLKGMDALQIAVCLNEKCKIFLTNDRKLTSITEIEVILVDDL